MKKRRQISQGSYQRIVYPRSQNDQTAKLCAWMYKVPDESNNGGQLPVTSNDCRKETFPLLGSHQDHCSKNISKRKVSKTLFGSQSVKVIFSSAESYWYLLINCANLSGFNAPIGFARSL